MVDFPKTDFEYLVKDDSVIDFPFDFLRDIVSRVATSTINVQRYNMAPFIQIVFWRRFGRGFVSVGVWFRDGNPPAGQRLRFLSDFPGTNLLRNAILEDVWMGRFEGRGKVFRWTQLGSLQKGSTSALQLDVAFEFPTTFAEVLKEAFQEERISGISD